MKKALLVNLFAGPGALKSTAASGVFTLLKLHGIECDAPHEFAKDLIWEDNYSMSADQIYVFGQQHHRIWRVTDKVDVILCDSPLLLSIVYRKEGLDEQFIEHVIHTHKQYNNLNIFIERRSEVDYEDNGRAHNYLESVKIDNQIKEVLNKYSNSYITMTADYTLINNITNIILDRLNTKPLYRLEKLS